MYGSNSSGGYSTGAGFGYGTSAASYGSSSYSNAAQNSHLSGDQLYAHSSIDSIVSHTCTEQPQTKSTTYVPTSAKGSYLSSRTSHDYFAPDTFLMPGSNARFIGSADEIKHYIEEAFTATTNQQLPKDIVISVLNNDQFKEAFAAHNGTWNEDVQGFSINANPRKVFARANPLDRLMLVIGHEIGHVLTPTVNNPHDEEAKAFAFSLAWMDTIKDKNIAGIGQNIHPSPANNGLHDKAFSFVQNAIKQGIAAWDAFVQIAQGSLTITQQPELIHTED